MSLINDAIKRAAKAQPNQPSPVTKPIQLQPAVHARPTAVWWLYFIPSLLVVCLAGGGYLVMRGWQHRQAGFSDMPQPSPLPVAARERALPATSPAAEIQEPSNPTAPAPPQPNGPGATQPAAEIPPSAASIPQAPPAVPVATTTTTAAPAPAPTFPELKLQGIYYRPSRPSATLNGKALFVGERIGQVEVIEITKDTVTVSWQQETRVLTLP